MTRNTRLTVVAVIVIVVVGIGLSQFASSQPDGLEYVAQEQGFDETAAEHPLADAPLAGYGENLEVSPGVSTAVAAIVGIAATAGLGFVVFRVARKKPDTHARA